MPNLQLFWTIVASKNLPTFLLDSRVSCVSTPYTVSPPAPASAIASSCRSLLLVYFLPLHSRGSPHSCAYSLCSSLCALDDVATGYTRRTPLPIPAILLDELVWYLFDKGVRELLRKKEILSIIRYPTGPHQRSGETITS